jgi:BON domain
MMMQQTTLGIPMECDAPGEEESRWTEPGYSLCPPHLVESEVSQTLRDTPGVHVESLSVHRVDGGVCLHGVVEIDDTATDIEEVIRRALSIDHVVNRMVVKYGPSAVCPISEMDQSFMWG